MFVRETCLVLLLFALTLIIKLMKTFFKNGKMEASQKKKELYFTGIFKITF